MFIMFSLALLVLTAANPILFPTLPSYTSRFFYWFLSLILYVLLLPLWVRLLIRYWSTSTQRPIPLLIATAPLVIALTAMCENLPELLGPIAPARAQPGTWLSYLQNVLIVHIVEMISLLWLLPLYRGAEPAVAAVRPPADVEPPEAFVVLNGRTFPAASIRWARSAEHYLILGTDIGTIELRARMRDFVEQVGGAPGIQIHRSFWISRNEALALHGNQIKTRTLGDVTVSRARSKDVRDWFRSQGLTH